MRPCCEDSSGECAFNLCGRFPHAGLPGPQKEKIYDVQEKYAAEIAPLAAKIKELQAERDKAIDAVLSADQLAKIKELKAEAAAKAAAGRKPAAKKTSAEPKTDKTATGN